jgi:hypothetical protein
VKNRRLPETDVANWAFLPPSQKEKVLAAWLKPRQANGSYDPYRLTAGDAVNQQLPLYPTRQVATPWDKLAEAVRLKCRGDDQLLAMNLPVAKATHEFASKCDLTAEPVEIGAITFKHGHRYEFGPRLVLRYDGGASSMFADLRRRGNLTPHGRRVVHSIMHLRYRENFPEYSSLRLETWRYQDNDERSIQVFRHEGEPLYSYDALSDDISETYNIMNWIRAGAQEQHRKYGDEDFGPLFRHGG